MGVSGWVLVVDTWVDVGKVSGGVLVVDMWVDVGKGGYEGFRLDVSGRYIG